MTSAEPAVGEEVIETDATAGRFDVAVSRAAGISRTHARRLIEQASALVDGATATPAHQLRGGERLTVRLRRSTAEPLQPESGDLVVVYEDDEILIVDKPAGLVVHPGPGHAGGTLVNRLLGRADVPEDAEPRLASAGGDWPGIVHRLDRDTSGLLMVAKTDMARQALRSQLAARSLDKEYVALVHGSPEAARGRIEAPIGRDPRDRQRMAIVAGGRDAVTAYEVLAAAGGYSLLLVRPLTGRTHQIRVHLRYLGLPIAGDIRYGGREGPGGLRRQFLHASRLTLSRPHDDARLTAWSELPTDLALSLDALGAMATDRLPAGQGAAVEEA